MPEVNLLIHAGHLVPAHDHPSISNGAVAVAGDTVEDCGTFAELKERYPGVKHIGGKEFLLIPGLINGHGHGRGLSTFQRGVLDNTLETWIWDTRTCTPVPVYEDTLYCACRLLKSGITASMHNHILSDPANYEAEFEAALRGCREAGLRVFFCPSIRNANPFVYGDNDRFLSTLPAKLKDFLTAPLPENVLTAEKYIDAVTGLHARHSSKLVGIGFGPLAPQWCSLDLLQEINAQARHLNTMVHIHALESVFQKIYGLAAFGKSLIKYMDAAGLLGPEVVVGHAVWATKEDIEILADSQVSVTHHPSSNLRLRVGIAPIHAMVQNGIRVGLGLDGTAMNDNDDMLQEMKLCSLLHRLGSLDLDSDYLTPRQIFKMVTEDNANIIGFGEKLGRLEAGRRADMVLLDYEQMTYPYSDQEHDPIETLLYRGSRRHVHTVIIGGNVVVAEGRVLSVDENDVAERLNNAASMPPTAAEADRRKRIEEFRGHLIQYYAGWPDRIRSQPFHQLNSRT